MRNISVVRAELAALGRPLHPGVAALTDRQAVPRWKAQLATWQATHPQGQAKHEALLEELEAIERAQVAAQVASARIREVGLPRKVAGALLVAQPTHAVQSARAWCDAPKQYLVLAGGLGTGKSVAAGHALVTLMERGRTGAWVSAAGFTTLAGGFGGQAACERLKHVDVLVVDDFGAEHMSSFAESVFFEVLAARHENEGRTIFTTNLDGPAFKQRLGSRLEDRVRSSVRWVTCAGASMRGAE